jgi:hypothetical protein
MAVLPCSTNLANNASCFRSLIFKELVEIKKSSSGRIIEYSAIVMDRNENISKAKHRDSVKLETRWAVRTSDIFQAINEVDPTIIHFSGHGSEADDIVFQNPDGSAKLVSKEAITMVIASSSDKIRLVFFNTCFSFRQAEIVSKHVDAAIGMNTSIGDDAAYVFASQFYSAIGFEFSLGKAFDQAKAQLMLEGKEEENTPELFTKDGLSADEIFLVKPAE